MFAASRQRKGTLTDLLSDHHQLRDARTLIVEPDPMRQTEAQLAQYASSGGTADIALNLSAAFEMLKHRRYAVLLVDYRLPDGDGLELLDWVDDETEVIMLAASAARSGVGAQSHSDWSRAACPA